MLNKAQFTLLVAIVLGGLCPGAAFSDVYPIINFGLEVPIPAEWADWKERVCTNEPGSPNDGFSVPFHSRGCEGLFDEPRIDFIVNYDVLFMARRPEELADFYCEKMGAKRTRNFSGKTPIYECNDIHEKNGLTEKKYFLLRKYSYKNEFGSRVVAATYYWKGKDENPAYRQRALELLINIHWLDDEAGRKLRGWNY